MTQVSISELKRSLSRYLREVRRGGEIQVLDRGRPVAMLTGLPAKPDAPAERKRERLIEAGVVRPGSGDVARVLDGEPLKLEASLVAALADDRDDRL